MSVRQWSKPAHCWEAEEPDKEEVEEQCLQKCYLNLANFHQSCWILYVLYTQAYVESVHKTIIWIIDNVLVNGEVYVSVQIFINIIHTYPQKGNYYTKRIIWNDSK